MSFNNEVNRIINIKIVFNIYVQSKLIYFQTSFWDIDGISYGVQTDGISYVQTITYPSIISDLELL